MTYMTDGLRYGDVAKIWRRSLEVLREVTGEEPTLTLQSVHYHIKKGRFNTEAGEVVEMVMNKVIEENRAGKRKFEEQLA